jgi:alpha-L-fucosidase 2
MMKKPVCRFCILSIFLGMLCKVNAQSDLKLWYNKPAEVWVEALPVGNGKIGAMIFGGTANELIQLNESTLYSGGPVRKNINPQSASYLPQVRKALMDEDYTLANELTKKMQGLYTESYMPLGDIMIRHPLDTTKISAYYRDLDLRNGISTMRFTVDGTKYERKIFVSAVDNVMVVHFTADKKAALNFTVSANSPLRYDLRVKDKTELLVSGKAPAHVDPSYYNRENINPVVYDDPSGCNGMRFQYRIKAVAADGIVTTDTSGIHISNSSEVKLYVTAATSFNGFDRCPDKDGKDENAIAAATMSKAVKKSYGLILSDHTKDFTKYFDRVSFRLKDTAKNNLIPSDERLIRYSQGAVDPALEVLYFQFGRYLLISCSRPGSPPANLQGIWNKELRAPWSSNYTININTQMNYWPVETTNLSELHRPLLDFLSNLAKTGAVTAKEFYNANGWVAHHNSEIWATSNPVGDTGAGDPVWANWYMGGNWLCQHLWEHFAFTRDTAFLRQKAYPIMKQAALFTIDWLVEDKNGYLVTAPSTSPENKFKDKSGKEQAVSLATTMDMAITWDLFTNLIEASTILRTDTGFRDTIIEKSKRLFPMQIGSKGQLQEWYKDFEDTDPAHRHVSHLFGLHPGRQISKTTNPEFFNAAKKTLEIRGDGGTGWSKGWKINWWARLLDGDRAYRLIRQLLQYTNTKGTSMRGGGTYPNFFDAHPPFQIDGNFAGTAGMTEMLLQSHLGEIHLLPALPSAWTEGAIKGLRARGGYEVGIQWKNNSLMQATVRSLHGGSCVIRSASKIRVSGMNVQPVKDGDDFVIRFTATKNKTYTITGEKPQM